MVRFSKLEPDGHGGLVESNIRTINKSDIAKCPHFILMPDHYRPDGTCKCNDPNDKDMEEWGYRWDPERKIWGGA